VKRAKTEKKVSKGHDRLVPLSAKLVDGVKKKAKDSQAAGKEISKYTGKYGKTERMQ
jgi:hypothetical protein